MTVDDRTRLELHRKLDAVLGAEEADTLMAHLPPVTWNDVATKDDLASIHTAMDAMGTQLRTEMNAMGTQLRTEMNAMGTQLRTEMQTMRAELHADFVDATNRQIKWLVTFAAAWSSLLVTVVRLLP
jgi:hypothetical protein